jgi:hypothetical protein
MLLKIIGNDFVDVIENVADWLVKRIQESIMNNVYDVPEGDYYQRLGMNGGFLGAWEQEATQFVGNYVSVFVGMNPALMTYNADEHQHGNSVEDRREFMDTLIASGDGYDFGGNAAMKRDYWTEIVRVVESGELDGILERFMTAKGIVWRRI